MRPGIRILEDRAGDGATILRQRIYRVRLKLWLNQGEPVRWDRPWGMVDRARLEDDGTTLISDLRYDRENLFPGLFQGIDGMRIGGMRKLKVSAHLAYGDAGIPGKIPPQAALVAKIEIIEERNMDQPT